jgi:oligoribonuclease (3'-5' exoribonuclease)
MGENLLRKYQFVAIDLETTGLDTQRDQILQIGAVAFDPKTEEQVEFMTLVKHDRYEGDAYALQMNANILWQLAREDHPREAVAIRMLGEFLDKLTFSPTYAVGFNVGQFDIAFLRKAGLKGRFHHRCIDLTTLFLDPKTGEPGNSHNTSMEHFKREVTHDALQDARDAAELFRRKWKVMQ